MRIFGVVGYKNNGKTTLVEKLVRAMAGRGLRVSTVKHAHHDVDVDVPGKDTWRHREAGASEVVLATAARYAVMRELRGEAEPTLAELVARMSPVDFVVVEGFKATGHPKIEVHRACRETPLLAAADSSVIAVASDTPLPGLAIPVVDLDDVEGILAIALPAAAPVGDLRAGHRGRAQTTSE